MADHYSGVLWLFSIFYFVNLFLNSFIICCTVIRADVIMEKEIKTRMAMNILNFEQDLHYETAEIRPHAGIDNFLWCMRKPS